ncbi:beta family protein [Sciscionella marina]|uniref:beta family protein n=1 Tax=Sciscionella marina TaxID=508770 RepID=UPI000A02BAF1|nr:beta family protein [Sciscionella marina]
MVAANRPLTWTDYVAILKCKAGELGAVKSCRLDNVVPLFEVVDPRNASTKLIQAWPASSGVVWVHSLNVHNMDERPFAAAVDSLFACLETEVSAVPVITTSEPASLLSTVRSIVAAQGRGLVLRLDVEEILEFGNALNGEVDDVLSACSVSPASVDLVVDAGLVAGTPSVRAAAVSQALQMLPSSTTWRSLVVALSAFPIDLSSVGKGSVGELHRNDANTFDLVTGSYTVLPLTYADYAIGVPTHDQAPFPPIPNIKYTHDRMWKVHRGHERKRPGQQYQALAVDLAAAQYFATAQFSPGDHYISAVAHGHDGPGNAMTYLRAGVSHHLHVVSYRLASLGVP